MEHMAEGGNSLNAVQNAVFIWFCATDKSSVRLRARLFFLALITTSQPCRRHIWTNPNVNTLLFSLKERGGKRRWQEKEQQRNTEGEVGGERETQLDLEFHM